MVTPRRIAKIIAVTSMVSTMASKNFCQVKRFRTRPMMSAVKNPMAPPSVAEKKPSQIPPMTTKKRIRIGQIAMMPRIFWAIVVAGPEGPLAGFTLH
ncbi:MAG: hypothetical protein A4E30_00182 [Methanomassiliicoccales archaeon PtaB.Bin215]|nr:MAG: hypothetical protein A4E30_00182 [Methanomassiliicoccales archaeon PtaB.Bin215]